MTPVNTPSTHLNSPSISLTSYDSVRDEITEAREELFQILETLKARGKTATCVSFIFMPCTFIATAILGCMAIPFSFSSRCPRLYESIWKGQHCKTTSNIEGTDCAGFSPCTVCILETEEGRINSLATEHEKERIEYLSTFINGHNLIQFQPNLPLV